MMNWPKSILMVSPDYFNIEYVINPYMADKNGLPNKVDGAKAMQQWLQLKNIFSDLDLTVEVLDGEIGLPDMVFCANQTFPFIKDGVKSIILSQMNANQRQSEVEHFSYWAQSLNYRVYNLDKGPFEGMGDALWNYETSQIFGGYGFRTSEKVYDQISEITGTPVIRLELKNEKFYHLDTCLSILNKNSAVVVPSAFTEKGLKILNEHFENIVEVPLLEAEKHFAANCFTPNGRDVIIQDGATETCRQLTDLNFNVIETDTSEYLKSGGSVFCLKQLLF